MILSAEMFEQIVGALRSDKRASTEQRAAPRVGLRAQADVLLNPGSRTPPVRMRVRDLSVSGIGLLHTRELPAGAEFIVLLPGGPNGTIVFLSCVVAHSRRLAADTFTVGGRIIRVMSPEEADMLVAKTA